MPTCRLDELSALLSSDGCARIRETLERAVGALPWQDAPRWVHGDLYGRHLLLDNDRHLCGVIDWGDLHLGDPALDLSVAFSFFDRSTREELFDAYGSVDDDARERARFRALNYGLVLLACGNDRGDETMAQLGDRALRLAVK